jgi:hypothetical protein
MPLQNIIDVDKYFISPKHCCYEVPNQITFCVTLKSIIECECSILILRIGLTFVMGIAMDGNKISPIGTFVEFLIFYACIEYILFLFFCNICIARNVE